MKFGVVQFPGTNCDYDCYHVLQNVLKVQVEWVWHKDVELAGFDCLILPGGFTYGDYLRVGAIARYSPVMKAIIEFAQKGGLVMGICNGFQMLTEAGLLPGTLIKNRCLHFICQQQTIKIENINTPFTTKYHPNQVLKIPIAHGEGCYYADKNTLDELIKNRQIIFRYCDSIGNINNQANPNGSLLNIAGVCNKEKNVLGLMPHPERSAESCLGSKDGLLLFESIILTLKENISNCQI
ncbi:MAG: phosphoribosylformylglycinamidine synthase subunit PurQ [Atribacterota bacterium]|nr:phosphoribosylformylglycinamidine synthase subunit PurQ [Atribacterota bacterium]